MAKFKTHPNTEIIGAAALAMTSNTEYEDYRHIIEPRLIEHGIYDIEPDGYYPLQLLLDTLYDVNNAMSNFVAIGRQAAKIIPVPPGASTLEEVLLRINEVYEMSMRNIDPEEFYEVIKVNDGHIRVRDNTPLPHDLIYGYIYTLVHQFAPHDRFPKIERVFVSPATPNDAGAIYDITW